MNIQIYTSTVRTFSSKALNSWPLTTPSLGLGPKKRLSRLPSDIFVIYNFLHLQSLHTAVERNNLFSYRAVLIAFMVWIFWMVGSCHGGFTTTLIIHRHNRHKIVWHKGILHIWIWIFGNKLCNIFSQNLGSEAVRRISENSSNLVRCDFLGYINEYNVINSLCMVLVANMNCANLPQGIQCH